MKLTLKQVDRSFGAVQVLHGIGIAPMPGEVHALIGENGAGKSATMKIMSGNLSPTGGQVALDDTPATFSGSQDAEASGLFLDKKAMRDKAAALLTRLD